MKKIKEDTLNTDDIILKIKLSINKEIIHILWSDLYQPYKLGKIKSTNSNSNSVIREELIETYLLDEDLLDLLQSKREELI